MGLSDVTANQNRRLICHLLIVGLNSWTHFRRSD